MPERDRTGSQIEFTRQACAMTSQELVGAIAHEINQPLAAVVANAQAWIRWLAADPVDHEEARSAAERIVRDANRASAVMERIRTCVCRDEWRRDPVGIEDILRDVAAMVQGEAHACGVTVGASVPPGLPAGIGDRMQIRQVLCSLAMNAIEAMSAAPSQRRLLEFGADRYGKDAVRLTVRDSGPGLGPGARDYAFEPFYTTKPNRMGMGLAVGRSVVEAHGGRLWSTPNEDGGETFQFTLRVAGTWSRAPDEGG
jgi:C4-dicarboxylate-specific signal transduction histidine kinase